VALAGVAALASGSLGGQASGGCARGNPCRGLRLPASITVAPDQARASAGFVIGRNGRVRRIAHPQSQSPFPQDAIWYPGTGTWFRLRHGHLIVGRGSKALWRSHGEIASRWQLGVVTVGPHTVAFQHAHKLYLAPLRGPERPVARAELPLGWTGGALYTYGYRGRKLLLRSDAGTLLRTIARRPLGSDYFVANGNLYFITHGRLMSARGRHIRQLASLARLGVSADPWLQSLGRLIELEDNNRLVVLRPDGSELASTPLPRSQGETESLSSSLVASPQDSAVAFTAAAGESNDPNAVRRAHGTETVFLLRAGARRAVPVHTERVNFKVCEGGAILQWHGRWLLYSNTTGNLAAIDSTRGHPAIELSSLAHSLLGPHAGFNAYWSREPFKP
jgi:hypothetical protein